MRGTTLEYVWIDGLSQLRSKIRVVDRNISTVKDVPLWNYDGSSTHQAAGVDSEIELRPCAIFYTSKGDRIFAGEFGVSNHILVMCETYYPNGHPCKTNHRAHALRIFESLPDEEPWFGLEQEYFLFERNSSKNSLIPATNEIVQGQYYCGVGSNNILCRELAEEHLRTCMLVGINISGINSEVAPGQWEFQIGPCVGIHLGDHLWMARYLLLKLSEKYNLVVNFEPKPIPNCNGSGCHANFSTKNMRLGTSNKTGLEYINDAIKKLSENHLRHMKAYGENNHLRMTGECETASYNTFTDGIANRGASVRRGHDTIRNKCGYFEDRRPAANCDPYLVTSMIFETCILGYKDAV